MKRKKKVKPVIPPKPERFLPHVAAQNGQIGRGRATGTRIKRIGENQRLCRPILEDNWVARTRFYSLKLKLKNLLKDTSNRGSFASSSVPEWIRNETKDFSNSSYLKYFAKSRG